MNDLLSSSMFFGGIITVVAYLIGCGIQSKWKKTWLNPVLISAILIAAFLLLFKVDYKTYNAGAKTISYFLTPATICLAVPLYEQLQLLRKNMAAVLCGIASGVLTSMLGVFLLSVLFRFSHAEYVTFLPKSVTSAIGMELSQEMGGYVALTVAVIILTGILGNVTAPLVLKLFRVTHPIAKGTAIGTASHAIGITKAIEMGEVEGAMSSLAIVVSGLMTVLLSLSFTKLY